MPIRNSLDVVVYLHNGKILSNENERFTIAHNKMDEYHKIMLIERSWTQKSTSVLFHLYEKEK